MISIKMGSNRGTASVIGKIYQSIFGLIFAGAGMFFITMSLKTAFNSEDSTKWTTANAIITHSSIIYPKGSRDDYSYDLKYQFTYANKKYTGTKIKASDNSGSLGDAQLYEAKYPKGKMLKCYVNPKNPKNSVLIPSDGKNFAILPFLLIPLIFVFVGFGITLSAWKAPKRKAISKGLPTTVLNKSNLKAKLGKCLFFAIFATVGTLLFYFLTVKTYLKIQESKSWHKTPCEIVNSRVKSQTSRSSKGGSSTTYSVDIVYKYRYNGQDITNDSYSFSTGSSSGYAGKQAVVRKYPKGKKTQCLVNPQNPYEAVIEPTGGVGFWVGLGFGLIFGAVGYGGIIVTLIGKGGKKRRKSKNYENRPQTIIDEYNLQWEEEPEENVELKAGSRLKKLVGITLFSLFWNGLSWTMAVMIFKTNNPVAKIFISIFLIVGAITVILVIKELLALTNAKVIIVASTDIVRVGEQFAITWAIPQKAERISELTISFVGTELATYRRGTNTHTDKKEFHNRVIAQTTDYNEIISGSAIIDLPSNTMHSFDSGNNEVKWKLKVHGDIKSWPDINDEYEIKVLPMGRN